MKRNVVKQFVRDLKSSLRSLCGDDEVLLYTCFNRYLTEKYIEFNCLKGIKSFLYSGIPDVFSEKTDIIVSNLKKIRTEDNIFAEIEIFDLCFQYYNFDEEGFYRKTQFYTPSKLAEGICNKIITQKIQNILEPSSGSGVFLRKIYDLGKKYEKDFNVTAVEIDKRAIQFSKITYSLNAYQKYGEKVLPDVENKDFLLDKFTKKYDCIIGNPPFLAKRYIPKEYRDPIKQKYNAGQENLAYSFLLKSLNLLAKDGYLGFVIPDNFLYLYNTQDFKKNIETNYENELINISKDVFKDIYGSKFSPCLIFIRNRMPVKLKKNTKKILTIGDIASVVTGIQTGNNKKYIKHFQEIPLKDRAKNIFQKNKKWYPYLKGGGYKKWSGNDEFFIYYQNNGEKLRKEKKSIIRNERFFKEQGITYSYYSDNRFSARYKEKGTIFDIGGSCLFFDSEDDLYYVLALLNSSVGYELLTQMNPTMSFQTSTIKNLPLIIKNKKEIVKLSKKAVKVSKMTDKFFSVSKNFVNPDFINKIQTSFKQDFLNSEKKFWNLKNKLIKLENEINKNFEEIYNIFPKYIYYPKPVNEKKVRKQMLKDFFDYIKAEKYEDVKKYIFEKYPLSANEDLQFIAKIINGKTFNNVKGTIERAIISMNYK